MLAAWARLAEEYLPARQALVAERDRLTAQLLATPSEPALFNDISVSELMRRAVLGFNATSEQVKVAGLVDKLRAPKTPDPLNVALRQVAERAAAREARDAAQVAREASKRTLAAEKAEGLAAPGGSDTTSASDASDEDASLSGRS